MFAADQLAAHYLVELALVECISGAVTVSVECKLSPGELRADVFLDDGFLVLYGGVVAVEFLVYRYSAVAGYAEYGSIIQYCLLLFLLVIMIL